MESSRFGANVAPKRETRTSRSDFDQAERSRRRRATNSAASIDSKAAAPPFGACPGVRQPQPLSSAGGGGRGVVPASFAPPSGVGVGPVSALASVPPPSVVPPSPAPPSTVHIGGLSTSEENDVLVMPEKALLP